MPTSHTVGKRSGGGLPTVLKKGFPPPPLTGLTIFLLCRTLPSYSLATIYWWRSKKVFPSPVFRPFCSKMVSYLQWKSWKIDEFFPVFLMTNISSLVYFNLFSSSKILSFLRVSLGNKGKSSYLFSFTWLSTFQLLYWLRSSWYIWVKF